MWDGGHMGGGFFGGGFMIFWWLIIIVAVVALIKWIMATTGGGTSGAGKSARQILDERYARGEIDKIEYEQRKRDLEQ